MMRVVSASANTDTMVVVTCRCKTSVMRVRAAGIVSRVERAAILGTSQPTKLIILGDRAEKQMHNIDTSLVHHLG